MTDQAGREQFEPTKPSRLLEIYCNGRPAGIGIEWANWRRVAEFVDEEKRAAYASGARAENEACARAICSGCNKGYKYQEGSHQVPENDPWAGKWFDCKAAAIRVRQEPKR